MLINRCTAAVSSNRAAGALAVRAGGRGTFLAADVHNPGAAAAYLQLFDVAAEDVELGTTVPVLAFAVLAGASRRIRPRRPLGGLVRSYAITSSRTGSGMPTEACSVSIAMSGHPSQAASSPADPLSVLDDDFEDGSADPTERGWTWYQESTVATAEVADGELHLESTTGGAAGAWIYNENRGNLLHKPVRGDFDFRSRWRVRNAAGSGSPTGGVPIEWRFAGPGVADPDDAEHNSLHLKLGGDPDGQNRIEWKTTDGDVSTWAAVAGSAPLDYDLRIVRQGQVFLLYYRRTDAGYALESDAGWTLVQTIDRTDNAVPARTGGAAAVAMPNEVWIYLTGGYAGPQTDLDIQGWCERAIVRTP
jgi:hypothetical protein